MKNPEKLSELRQAVEELPFSGKPDCVMRLGNLLQDVLDTLTAPGYKSSGELIELKNCSWTLHERYFLDTEEQVKWTFYHCRFRILKSLQVLLEKQQYAALVLNPD